MRSFYSLEELQTIGFQRIGKDVLISRKCSIYSPEEISIGDHVRIDDFCSLAGKITLGNYIHIASYSLLYGGKIGIEMQDFSGISSRCVLYAATDDYSGKVMTNAMVPDKYRGEIKGKIILQKHAILGSGSAIIPGSNQEVVLAEGTAVGAMSFIHKSTMPWKIYFGVPAKIVANRKRDLLNLEQELSHDRL